MKTGLIIAAAFALGLAAACGGTVDNTGTPSDCQATLSGAVSGSGKCTIAIAYGNAANQLASTVTISTPIAGVQGSMSVIDNTSTTLKSSYTASSNTSSAVATLTTTDGHSGWSQGFQKSPAYAVGTFSESFTDLGSNVGTSSGGAYFNTHGIFDATLPAATSTAATGTITVHVTF